MFFSRKDWVDEQLSCFKGHLYLLAASSVVREGLNVKVVGVCISVKGNPATV